MNETERKAYLEQFNRRTHVLGEVQHRLLHVALRAQPLQPFRLDIDVAGRAGARPAAVGVDPRNVVLHGPFHDGPALRRIGRVLGPVRLDVQNPRHASSPWFFIVGDRHAHTARSLCKGVSAALAKSQ